MMQPHSIQSTASPVTALAPGGFSRGTEVITLAGTRPVESLHEGDRIITRTGARTLNSIKRLGNDIFALGFDRAQVIFLVDGQAHSDTGLAYAT